MLKLFFLPWFYQFNIQVRSEYELFLPHIILPLVIFLLQNLPILYKTVLHYNVNLHFFDCKEIEHSLHVLMGIWIFFFIKIPVHVFSSPFHSLFFSYWLISILCTNPLSLYVLQIFSFQFVACPFTLFMYFRWINS